jgi:hypothetical protein
MKVNYKTLAYPLQYSSARRKYGGNLDDPQVSQRLLSYMTCTKALRSAHASETHHL